MCPCPHVKRVWMVEGTLKDACVSVHHIISVTHTRKQEKTASLISYELEMEFICVMCSLKIVMCHKYMKPQLI